MSLRDPYDYLKSLQSFLGQNDFIKSCVVLTISVRCCTEILRSTCDLSTGLRFFKSCHSAELNKIVEATMPVNPYDDPQGLPAVATRKGLFEHRTGIVYSSEGKCNRGIRLLFFPLILICIQTVV